MSSLCEGEEHSLLLSPSSVGHKIELTTPGGLRNHPPRPILEGATAAPHYPRIGPPIAPDPPSPDPTRCT